LEKLTPVNCKENLGESLICNFATPWANRDHAGLGEFLIALEQFHEQLNATYDIGGEK
jgi:hypothetical protein